MLFPKSLIAGTAGIALGLFLGGCNSTDGNPVKPAVRGPIGTADLKGSSDFDRDLIAAKRGSGNSVDREEAIEAVLSKYGVPHPAAKVSEEPQAGPVAMAAAKTSSTASSFAPIVRSFTADNDIHTFRKTVTVGPFQYLVVSAVGEQDGVDPFLVAYYRNDASTNQYAYAVKVAAYNDDVSSSNRNSTLTWVNGNFTSRTVEIVAFNYMPSTRGTVTISIGVNGSSSTYASRFLGGKVVYGTDPIPAVPDNCYPSFTRVTETNRYEGGFSAAGLVIDAQAMKGGMIWDLGGGASQSLDFTPFINNQYPNFALLFEATSNKTGSFVEEASGYAYKQQDYYSCVR